MVQDKKSLYLLILVLISGIFYTIKLWPLKEIPARISVLIMQNNVPVTGLDQERDPVQTRIEHIDHLNFPLGREMTHAGMGPLGITDNIFIDFKTAMISQTGGVHEFLVVTDYFSDSITRISVNGIPVGIHSGNQMKSLFRAELERNINILEVNYSKGTDVTNKLKVYYRPPHHGDFYYIGENSDNTLFMPSSLRD